MAFTDNLQLYWTFDETSGNPADSYGSETLTDHNSVGTGAGKLGNARVFTMGSLHYFSRSGAGSVIRTGDIDFYWATWIKLTTLPSSGSTSYMVLSKGDVGVAANCEYAMFVNDSDNKAYFSVSDGATVTFRSANSFGALSTGTYYFLEGWHDAVNNLIGCSVNLTEDTTSYSAGVQSATNEFRVGADTTGRYFNGAADETGFWKRIPSASERSVRYNSGNATQFPFEPTGKSVSIKQAVQVASTY